MVCNELNNLVIEKPNTLCKSLSEQILRLCLSPSIENPHFRKAFEDPIKLIPYDSHLSSAVTAQFKVKTSC